MGLIPSLSKCYYYSLFGYKEVGYGPLHAEILLLHDQSGPVVNSYRSYPILEWPSLTSGSQFTISFFFLFFFPFFLNPTTSSVIAETV